MMQCPACSAPLVSGEARCVSCQALVNPPTQGASALAPRLVTPQSLEGFGPSTPTPKARQAADAPAEFSLAAEEPDRSFSSTPTRNPADEAWRREVLERVRKRRQVRTHALPLFVEAETSASVENPPAAANAPNAVSSPLPASPALTAASTPLPLSALPLDAAIVEKLAGALEAADPRPAPPAPDVLGSLDVETLGSEGRGQELADDLPLRPLEAESDSAAGKGRAPEMPSQSLVERPRPTLVTGPSGTRSLVADLPLVEPTPLEPTPFELPPRVAQGAKNPRAASMNDRVQAALIDLGIWSATCVTAFYFASRIARTSILGLAPSWHGLALFALVIAAAYVLFFGGLTGATPGKIACGIQVRRYDGSSLGPLASLGRGVLGVISVALIGIGIWPAFWDRDRRTLHDRATESRVTLV